MPSLTAQWPKLEGVQYRPMLSLKDISESLPGKPHPQTVRRWYRRGIAGVRMPITRIGGVIYVEPRQFAAWLDAVGKKCGDVTELTAAAS